MFQRTLPLLVPSTSEGEELVWQTQVGPHRDVLRPTSEDLQFASALNFFVRTVYIACSFYFNQQCTTYIYIYIYILF